MNVGDCLLHQLPAYPFLARRGERGDPNHGHESRRARLLGAGEDTYRPLPVDLDDDLGRRCRIHERVFDQIAWRIGNCRSVAGDYDRTIGTGQRDRSPGWTTPDAP